MIKRSLNIINYQQFKQTIPGGHRVRSIRAVVITIIKKEIGENMTTERKLAINANYNGQTIVTILNYVYNWDQIMDYDELEVELFYLTPDELKYTLSESFDIDTFTNEYCKLINEKPIKEVDFDRITPDSIKVAVRDAFAQGYSAFGICYDWEAQNCFDFSFDYLVNDYLLEGDSQEFTKRINNIYLYASNQKGNKNNEI